ncbi:Phage integrase family protein [Methylobacterium sp. UNC378MF]|uniref:tyrosine-type recombinase/integrase n=1 Tax=Methylobacterium sp. UNC378MF TaxID=1502748 RepID=UPI0008867724|nr:site-specific integrase [Methylobacterium sp. UNC378MF]SDA28315.1 Phage integrase family protein [Methylobacterium sp. UNC378MF]
MTNNDPETRQLPRARLWLVPRALPKDVAAAYVGCRTIRAFEAQVRRGLFPKAMPGTSQWDRRALDSAIGRLSSLSVAESQSSQSAAIASTGDMSNAQDTMRITADDSTPSVKGELRGVKTVKKSRADGSTVAYFYHRATRTKLPGSPGSPEFQGALAAARAHPGPSARQAADRHNFGGLIRKFCTSSDWRNLADSSRASMVLNLKAVEARWGEIDLDAFSSKAIRADVLTWRDQLAEKAPRAADLKVGAFSRVLSWGLDRGLVADNPLAGVRSAHKCNRADRIWLPEHVDAFMATATPKLQLALLLGLHTGQRQGDIRAMRWEQYDGRAISLTQGKTKRRVWIPCTQALKAALDAARRTGETIITDRAGRLWEKRAFARAWTRVYQAAGLPSGGDSLHFHDLRGTAVTMLSEAGCTPQEVATVTGHAVEHVHSILQLYLSRTRALAESAIAKLETHSRNVERNALMFGHHVNFLGCRASPPCERRHQAGQQGVQPC